MKWKFLFVTVLMLVSCKDIPGSHANISTEEQEEDVVLSSESLASQNLVSVVDYKGLTPLLERENDTTYVVNFWATWCRPCIKELPAFEQLGAEYQNKKVKVVLVSLDFPEKLESQVIPFLKNKKIASDVILLDDADANSWIPKISEDWSGAIPATIIYKNKERRFYERSFTFTELETEVQLIQSL